MVKLDDKKEEKEEEMKVQEEVNAEKLLSKAANVSTNNGSVKTAANERSNMVQTPLSIGFAKNEEVIQIKDIKR